MHTRLFGMKWWIAVSVFIVGLLAMGALTAVARADSETILFESFDSFGEAGSSVNDIPDWFEEGVENSATTRAQAPDEDEESNDSASPDGGRFAKIKRDEWICREVDATGHESLELSYYWRGDKDAEGDDDLGVVEYSTDYDDCDAADWTELQSHDMSAYDEWNIESAFDLSELDDTTFLLRFRTASTANDEHFRVDGIELTGEVTEPGDEDEEDPSELYGYKFHDLNRDGEWYTGGEIGTEPGVEGWTIYATPITEEDGEEDTESGRTAKSAITDENGEYEFAFTSNDEGWWRISEENRSGWTQTYPGGEIDLGLDPYYYDVEIEEGEEYDDYNFGNWRSPVVEIFKWDDVNENGEQDENESPAANYPIAVGRVVQTTEGDEGQDTIDIEIVALELTGSNGTVSVPLNPDWWGGISEIPIELVMMVLEGVQDNWTKTYPTQTHNDQVNISFRESLAEQPLHIDSFFDVFVNLDAEWSTTTEGFIHGTEDLVLLRFGNHFTEPVTETPPETPSDSTSSNGGGGGGGGIISGPLSVGFQNSGSGGGQVLGASTFTPSPAPPSGQCSQFVNFFMGPNRDNDLEQVKHLQQILLNEGFAVEVNGVFDDATLEAVKGFQLKYADEILAPWGITNPTGFVYLTTRKKLNEIHAQANCPLSDEEHVIIENYKKGQGSGGGGGTPDTTLPGNTMESDEDDEDIPANESQVGAAGASMDGSGFWKRIRTFFGL